MKTESTRHNIISNIWKLNLIQAFRWFMLIMPVIVLFYKENGLSMQDIMVLQALYSLALVIFEVPSGYFSDTLGRRNSLVAGSILCALCVCVSIKKLSQDMGCGCLKKILV